jgi:hypothetical protein
MPGRVPRPGRSRGHVAWPVWRIGSKVGVSIRCRPARTAATGMTAVNRSSVWSQEFTVSLSSVVRS